MTEPKVALIIEDNGDIVQAVSLAFKIRWPKLDVISTPYGEKGILLVETKKPNVVVLDLGLPDISGFEVIKEIRLFSKIPIIVLTVRDIESDIVRALELGADDYVVKPFRQLELTSRVNAQMRHDDLEYGEIIRLGNYSLDLKERVMSIGPTNIGLTRIETIIVDTLLSKAGRVVTHTELSQQIWGDVHPSTMKNVRIHIKRLRNKLEKEAGQSALITTKTGIGYLFTG